MAFFTELEQKNLKICTETQKTLNSQSSLEGKKRSWRNQTPDYTRLQTILQSYSNQDNMVLAQKQNRSMEQDRKPRYIPTYGQLIYDKGGKYIQWRKNSLQ